ncbi:MAG: hypothetical protein QOG91_468, partial [Candidatus Parcubacteria bacterium]|nr:hypothetical protein [Candidatus Parcubacteria bacterium]
MKHSFDITVIVTRYGEPDSLVKQCLESLRAQKETRILVLFLDQKVSDDIKIFCEQTWTDKITLRYVNIPAKSLSYARNFGVEHAESNFAAFCDADCILAENWTKEIIETFRKTGAALVGTKIIPVWQSRTSWYHRSRIIQEFYSLIDLSDIRIEANKAVGASFAIDRNKVGARIIFDEKLDRQKGSLLSGGDTEYCKNVKDAGGKIVYTPHTFARHVVSPERINFGWIVKRAYYGGFSRALRKGKIEPFTSQRRLIDYLAVATILPSYIYGYARGKASQMSGKASVSL